MDLNLLAEVIRFGQSHFLQTLTLLGFFLPVTYSDDAEYGSEFHSGYIYAVWAPAFLRWVKTNHSMKIFSVSYFYKGKTSVKG